MQKGFGLIGILLVIGIIAIFGIGVLKMNFPIRNLLVPTSEERSAIKEAEEAKKVIEQKNNTNTNTVADETKDWKTYRNEEYGFEFKYPKNWFISEEKLSNDNPGSYLHMRVSISNSSDLQGQKMNKENMDTISVFEINFRGSENPQQLDIEKWYQVSHEGNDEIISKKIITIGGRKAICAEMSWHDFIVQRCFVPNGTSIIEIRYSPSQSKFINDYKNIFSTFKFTK